MQNMNIKNAVESGALMCAYSPSTLQGFLDLEDLGAVASLVILNPEPHNRARYELVGENATPEDIAKTVARVAGCSKGIKCEQIARSEVIQRGVVHVRGAGEYSAEALDRMLYYYDKRCGWTSKLSKRVERGADDGTLLQGHPRKHQHRPLVARARPDVVGGAGPAHGAVVVSAALAVSGSVHRGNETDVQRVARGHVG